MTFKEWFLRETMTSTACIAGFARPMMGVIRRPWLNEKKKKTKKKN